MSSLRTAPFLQEDIYGCPDGQNKQEVKVKALFTGTSPGEEGVHQPERLPVDTVVYLANMREISRELTAKAILYVDSENRFSSDTGRQGSIDQRTKLLTRIAAAVDPAMEVLPHSELERRGSFPELESPLKKIIMTMPNVRKQDRLYTSYQTRVVRGVLDLLEAKPGELGKVGWYAEKEEHWQTGEVTYKGGEVGFDSVLPRSWGITPHYVMPGFGMQMGKEHDRTAGANRTVPATANAPYLLKIKDEKQRLCIPESKVEIDRELEKIQPGITLVSVNVMRTVAAILLHDDDAIQKLRELNEHCWEQRCTVMTNEQQLKDVRAHLEAAFSRFNA